MSNPLAIFTADWHVRKYDRVWPQHPTLAGDTAFAIRQILGLTAEYGVRHLLLGGDNFEERAQRSDATDLMRHTMDCLQQARVSVYYVQGQHELAEPPFLSALHRHPYHIHGQTVNIGGIKVYGLDYQRPHRVEEAFAAIPEDTEWLLTHQVWKNLMGDDRGYAWSHWLPCAPLVLTGDYHDSVDGTWTNVRNFDMGFISPGTIAMQAIDENPHKSVVLLHDDSSWQRLALRTRPFHIVYINTQDDLDQFVATEIEVPDDLPDEIATPIVRVVYSTAVQEVRARVAAAHGDRAHLFWKPQVAMTEQQDADVAERIRTVMDGGFPAVVRRHYGEDPANADIAIRLYEADDVEREIATVFNELTGEETHGADHDREGPLQGPSGGDAAGAGRVARGRRPRL